MHFNGAETLMIRLCDFGRKPLLIMLELALSVKGEVTEMTESVAGRLAKDLLQRYGFVGAFDVDFMDPATNRIVADELRRLGCTITGGSTLTSIRVVCPAEEENASEDQMPLEKAELFLN